MLGIPSADQINAAVQSAIESTAAAAGGLEKATAADLQASVAAAVAGLMGVEAQAARDLASLLPPVVEVVKGLTAELAAWRALLSKGFSVIFGSQL